MATLLEQYAMKSDADLKNRVESAVSKTAQNILSSEPGTTPNSRNRRKWAENAAGMPELFSARMLWSVVGNPTIQGHYVSTTPHATANIPDGDIEFVVADMVDNFAQG